MKRRTTNHRHDTAHDEGARAVQEALDSRDNGGDAVEHDQPGGRK